MKPILKVCGLKDIDNIKEIASIYPDYLGFICYNKSKRYISKIDWQNISKNFESINSKKVGVFVNPNLDEIETYINTQSFDVLQLHGNENVEFIKKIKENFGIKIWKVISVDENIDFNMYKNFSEYVDLFLLDTKTSDYGGSGKVFNWDILKTYSLDKPYILSGGLSLDNISLALKTYKEHKDCRGFDVNSGFEIAPALKDFNKLKELRENLNKEDF